MAGQLMYAELEGPPVTTAEDRSLQMALELSSLGLLGSATEDSSSSVSYDEASKNKKSQNMTECVPVPSSEHVAEIVGRQGCKIKALRAKTSTYIKTPVRGDEPVFVVTGRKEDVAMARREIQHAAEHFTQIRATRNKAGMHTTTVAPLSGLTFPMPLTPGNTSPDLTSPGTITLQVRVPYRVVGLVVGPKGATIKRIQSQTHTYIVTPSRDKEPVFEVTGLPENVEKAKEEIEAHIAARTGSQSRDIDDDFASNGTVVGSPASFSRSQTNYTCRPPVLSTRPDLFSLSNLDSPFINQFSGYQKYPQTNQSNTILDMTPSTALGVFGQHNQTGVEHYEVNADSITSPTLGYDTATPVSWPSKDLPEIQSFLYGGGNDTSNVPSLSHQASLASSIRLSPTFSDDFSITQLGMQPPLSHPVRPPVHRVGSDSVDSTGSSLDFGQAFTKQSNGINIESGYSSSSQTDSLTSGSPVENVCFGGSRSSSPPRVCIICKESAVMAALVPCGHNHFCFECADKTAKNSAQCPCCNRPATYALLIKT